ncbi:baseplate assembly protein [Chitinimonas sp. BJB300]|nr:baseplate assembly protein [Chitinimonas sp. BJB300]TSJ88257.1 baseplate assembly protein [Chitinimonas sp. BJB300]
MHPHTGQTLTGIDHLKQSISCVLTTPIGSRVMRRDFGSLLPALIDQPINRATIAKLNAAVVMALLRWEPRIQLSRVLVAIGAQAGEVVVSIDCTRRDEAFRQQKLDLSLRLQMGART